MDLVPVPVEPQPPERAASRALIPLSTTGLRRAGRELPPVWLILSSSTLIGLRVYLDEFARQLSQRKPTSTTASTSCKCGRSWKRGRACGATHEGWCTATRRGDGRGEQVGSRGISSLNGSNRDPFRSRDMCAPLVLSACRSSTPIATGVLVTSPEAPFAPGWRGNRREAYSFNAHELTSGRHTSTLSMSTHKGAELCLDSR
jgi:hypothetical protein